MRRNKVVVNSTPIIALREIGRLEILRDLYGSVVIPSAVLREVTVKDPRALDRYPWIVVENVDNLAAKEVFSIALHDGEVEVMLLAKEIGADLIILDDGLARRHARYFGLNITGTVGLLLRAKERGLIAEVKPILDELIANDFYISEHVYKEILHMAGETYSNRIGET